MPRFPWLRQRKPRTPPPEPQIGLLFNGMMLSGPFSIAELQLMAKYGGYAEHDGGRLVDVGTFAPYSRTVSIQLWIRG